MINYHLAPQSRTARRSYADLLADEVLLVARQLRLERLELARRLPVLAVSPGRVHGRQRGAEAVFVGQLVEAPIEAAIARLSAHLGHGQGVGLAPQRRDPR